MSPTARSPGRSRSGRVTALLAPLLLAASAVVAVEAHCPPLDPPPPGETIVEVTPDQAQSLPSIVVSAAPHTTVLLADGVYALQSNIQFGSPHVTLRSASGDRDAVVLDAGYRTGASEPIFIAVDHVTVADLTIRRAWHHPVHVVGGGHHATLYNLRIEDGRQQFVKVNASDGDYADFGVAACSSLELTAAGRAFIHDNPTDPFLCYTGGFDLHQSWGWVIRDTVIENIYCTNGGLAEHAIHFFHSNREPVVERNLILHNARGIGFGLGQDGFLRDFDDDPFEGTEMEGREDEVMQIGGVIQNNVIYADIGLRYDSGIGLESAWKPLVRHNTIYSDEGSFNSAIDVRFSGSVGVVLANNLYHPVITLRNGAPEPERHANVVATPDLFVDLGGGDLHLLETAAAAIDQGWDSGLGDDVDGEARDEHPDVGADEHLEPNTAPEVVIEQPLDGSSFEEGTTIDFSGTATDAEEGDLTGELEWTSSLDGAIGSGGSPAATLSLGLHAVEAAVVDGGGLVGSDEIAVGVTAGWCPAELALRERTIGGAETARAVFRITTGPALTIDALADVDLRAGGSIALGNGTAILASALLRAGTTPLACD